MKAKLSIIESVPWQRQLINKLLKPFKIRVNVRFTNRNKETDNFWKNFWILYDYPANQQLSGATLNSAIKVILKELHKIYLMNLLCEMVNIPGLMRLKNLKSGNERNCL
jgi:hypothetical protein